MKRMTALLLAVMMALTLCACGEKEEESPAGPADGPETSLSATAGSNQQSTGTLSGLFGSKEGAALYEKYKDIIDALEEKNYNRAIQLIAELSNADKPKEEKTPITSFFTGTWYIDVKKDNADAPRTVTLSDSGTVTVDGTALTWLQKNSSTTSYGGWLLKDGVYTYYLNLQQPEGWLAPRVDLYTVKQSGSDHHTDQQLGSYYNDAMLGWMLESWSNLDPQDKVMPKNFSLGIQGASVQNASLPWTVTQTADSTVTAELGDAWTLRVELRDSKPLATLTEKATGNTACYCSSSLSYDCSWPEYIYPRAIQYLNESVEDMEKGYAPGFYSYIEDSRTSTHYTGNAALRYLYDTFTALGSYKDSAQIAGRFTILKDMHTNTQIDRVNNMGNLSTDKSFECYTYNAKGQMIAGSSNAVFAMYGCTSGYTLRFFYDDQGRLERVQQGTGNNLQILITPEYDGQGRMTGGTYKNNSGSNTLSYVYDDQGRLVENIVWGHVESYRYKYNYTYDAQGRMTREVCWLGWDEGSDYRRERTVTDYTYDDQGHLIQEVSTFQSYHYWDNTFSAPSTTTVVYTNDAQGRPLSAQITGSSNYSSQTLTFHYDDLYFYQDYTFIFNP